MLEVFLNFDSKNVSLLAVILSNFESYKPNNIKICNDVLVT